MKTASPGRTIGAAARSSTTTPRRSARSRPPGRAAGATAPRRVDDQCRVDDPRRVVPRGCVAAAFVAAALAAAAAAAGAVVVGAAALAVDAPAPVARDVQPHPVPVAVGADVVGGGPAGQHRAPGEPGVEVGAQPGGVQHRVRAQRAGAAAGQHGHCLRPGRDRRGRQVRRQLLGPRAVGRRPRPLRGGSASAVRSPASAHAAARARPAGPPPSTSTSATVGPEASGRCGAAAPPAVPVTADPPGAARRTGCRRRSAGWPR